MRKSSDRRIRRGESVVIDEEGILQRTLLKAGAAELFQAEREGEVLSSIFSLFCRGVPAITSRRARALKG